MQERYKNSYVHVVPGWLDSPEMICSLKTTPCRKAILYVKYTRVPGLPGDDYFSKDHSRKAILYVTFTIVKIVKIVKLLRCHVLQVWIFSSIFFFYTPRGDNFKFEDLCKYVKIWQIFYSFLSSFIRIKHKFWWNIRDWFLDHDILPLKTCFVQSPGEIAKLSNSHTKPT